MFFFFKSENLILEKNICGNNANYHLLFHVIEKKIEKKKINLMQTYCQFCFLSFILKPKAKFFKKNLNEFF